MNGSAAVAALVVAVVAGARGIWSPCGLSMLSTITPIGERGRGNDYRATARWYIVGATAGGLTLGAVMAVLAVGARAVDLSRRDAVGILALGALLAAASDARLGGLQLPFHRRQVNERWLDRYRAWVYGAGFGWQIGTAFGTYVMTAANYLLVMAAALSRSAAVALAAGGLFGLTRGMAVLWARDVRDAEMLRRLHAGIQRTGPLVRDVTIVTELLVAAALASTIDPVAGLVALVVGGVVLAGTTEQRRQPACSLDAHRGQLRRADRAVRRAPA